MITLLIYIFTGTNLFGLPGELIFKYNQSSQDPFTVVVDVTGFFWSWDENDIMFLGDNSTFPRTYQNASIYLFDSSKDHAIADPQPIMPWGLMHYAFQRSYLQKAKL